VVVKSPNTAMNRFGHCAFNKAWHTRPNTRRPTKASKLTCTRFCVLPSTPTRGSGGRFVWRCIAQYTLFLTLRVTTLPNVVYWVTAEQDANARQCENEHRSVNSHVKLLRLVAGNDRCEHEGHSYPLIIPLLTQNESLYFPWPQQARQANVAHVDPTRPNVGHKHTSRGAIPRNAVGETRPIYASCPGSKPVTNRLGQWIQSLIRASPHGNPTPVDSRASSAL